MFVKARPILFSGPMVQALLVGRKTQTRRPVNPQPPENPLAVGGKRWGLSEDSFFFCGIRSPYGRPGDRLWVRETLAFTDGYGWRYKADGTPLEVLAGDPCKGEAAAWCRRKYEAVSKVCPSIFMPRWASRITLEIESIAVERLQDLSEADARAEGVFGPPKSQAGWRQYPYESCHLETAKESYATLVDSIHDRGYWESNPWVWVIGFKHL